MLGCTMGFFWIMIAFMPESPRWLLSHGRTEEAKKIITKIVGVNKLALPNLDLLDHYKLNEPPKRNHPGDLLRMPFLRRNLLLVISSWFSVGICMMGLTYNTPSFDWSPNLIFCVPAFLLLPMAFVLPFLQNKFGRKAVVTGGFGLSFVALLASVAVPKDYFTHNWPIVVLAWIACATLDIVWATLLVFTKELFPTTHRTMALGIASAACRMGSVLSPYVILLDVYDPVLSLGFYSCLSLSSGILSLWIWPETKALRLPDTLEEAEKAASMPNSWLRKCNSNSV